MNPLILELLNSSNVKLDSGGSNCGGNVKSKEELRDILKTHPIANLKKEVKKVKQKFKYSKLKKKEIIDLMVENDELFNHIEPYKKIKIIQAKQNLTGKDAPQKKIKIIKDAPQKKIKIKKDTHEMPDGSIHSGKTHTKDSKEIKPPPQNKEQANKKIKIKKEQANKKIKIKKDEPKEKERDNRTNIYSKKGIEASQERREELHGKKKEQANKKIKIKKEQAKGKKDSELVG